MNNIFNFATSELSQDAFIAWALNWINEDKSLPLYEMAADLLKVMGETDDSIRDGIEIRTQLKRIDILVTIKNCNRAIIIEDKTYTSEHDNQIARYRDEITKLPTDVKTELCIDDKVEIRTVYLKTGFMYDDDKQVQADVKIDGWKLKEIIAKYKNKSEILDSYIEFLSGKDKLEYYKIHDDFRVPENIKNHTIAQYRLMRSFFPEEMWDGKGELYKVYDGTNRGGSPWTEMAIYIGSLEGQENEIKHDEYWIFWRIDKDSKGSYISLRFYNVYDKNNEDERAFHIEEYEKLKETMNEALHKNANSFSFEIEKVTPGYRGNYKEAEIFTWHIGEFLTNWETCGPKVIRDIRLVNELFLKELECTK